MIRYNKYGGLISVLTNEEVNFLGNLYCITKEKKRAFKEYIEEFQSNQVNEFIEGMICNT